MERRKEQRRGRAFPDEPTLEEELAAVMAELQKPVPLEEIERRRKLVAKTLKLREEMGPIEVSVSELVRELREGETRD